MKLDFSELLTTLNNEFGKNVGMSSYYVRSDVTNSKFQILLQHYLDPLCVEEFEFVVVPNDGVIVKSFKYNDKIGDGKMSHPYDVILKDDTKPISLKNIDSINVRLTF
ncbi:hypothetical protein Belba_1032 [Belliella baltica DSM 15883]|uniref:Uncharacterized protein n=1 Tax=Belliella baltica (strain DSM 15883 / CIP 108006 / LMG 21964 / BA134) TaxID=866536 RepID=I3Z355_BELBD|nr:hypothetical protein [Belliella baltica]AFL83673.1 hypothetical protein Belba_1032 [Belliella baltica DSM 15883]